MVESVLVMIPLVFFLFLSPAIWKMWITDQYTRVSAHRDTFLKMYAPFSVNIQDSPSVPVFLGGLGTGSPKKAAVPALKLDGKKYQPDKSLTGYTLFANVVREGRHKQTVRYSNGFKEFRGEFDMARWAYTLRPPWTFSGYPFIASQYGSEKNAIYNWYKKAYEKAMTKSVHDYTRVDKKPVK